MGTASAYHTANLLPDGRVLILGASPGSSAVELYDPTTGTFSPTGLPLTTRISYSATTLSDGRVLIIGGFTFSNGFRQAEPLASAEVYDPKTGTFGPTGPMTTAREYSSATLLSDGRVLVAGGFTLSNGQGEATASAELYQP